MTSVIFHLSALKKYAFTADYGFCATTPRHYCKSYRAAALTARLIDMIAFTDVICYRHAELA